MISVNEICDVVKRLKQIYVCGKVKYERGQSYIHYLLLFESTELRRSYLNWVSEARLIFITKLIILLYKH